MQNLHGILAGQPEFPGKDIPQFIQYTWGNRQLVPKNNFPVKISSQARLFNVPGCAWFESIFVSKRTKYSKIDITIDWVRQREFSFRIGIKQRTIFALLSVALPSSFLCGQECLLIAHRGASHDAPENTLASVNLAWKRGASAVEIDVHLSSDGQVVVLHDFNTRRLCGRDREVKDQTVAELRELDAGLHKGKRWEGERIPLLDEVLATAPAGGIFFVEIKVGPGILPALAESVARSELSSDQIVMISFNWETVATAKQAFPYHRVFALSDFTRNEETQAWEPSVEDLIERARDVGADGLDLKAIDTIDACLIAKIKEADLGAYVWTVNDPALARKLKRAGIDGITTDRPRWLAEKLSR